MLHSGWGEKKVIFRLRLVEKILSMHPQLNNSLPTSDFTTTTTLIYEVSLKVTMKELVENLRMSLMTKGVEEEESVGGV